MWIYNVTFFKVFMYVSNRGQTYGPTDKHTSHIRREFSNFMQASRDAVVGFIKAACQNIYTSV